jgi:tetratricopeptide (TPR) repeat protein
VRKPALKFVPGALASMFLSSDARTFTEPPAAWTPGRTHPQDYAGSSQSLVGDFVRAGATGISGHVSEPYLDGSIRPDILFPAYVSGFNLAESYYLAMPYLSWQSVIVGDPLCAPFRSATLVPDNIDPPIDTDTELPALFAPRRLATSVGQSASSPATKLIVRAEARLARADAAGAADALKQALAIDATSVVGWRSLGVVLDSQHNYSEAAAAYERALKLDRNDVRSLNNLAYILAVHNKRPADALPLATRAGALDSRNGIVQDTLGWIHHLLGEDQEAAKLLAAASRAEPGHPEIQFHTAVVLDLVGRRDEAAKALQAADALDPTLKERADFRELQRKITGNGQSKE